MPISNEDVRKKSAPYATGEIQTHIHTAVQKRKKRETLAQRTYVIARRKEPLNVSHMRGGLVTNVILNMQNA